jgi:hypothetical protein
MMIIWKGENCSDGCPFYNFDMTADRGVSISNPRCGVAGHEDVGTEKVFDIRLEMKGKGADSYCPKGDGCPFLDVHSLHLEVHNHAE